MKTKIFRASKRTLSVFLAILMIVSTMLVGMVTVNSYEIYKNANIYFNNSKTNWPITSSNPLWFAVTTNGIKTTLYKMSSISDTSLYYVNIGENGWSNSVTYYTFFVGASDWGGGSYTYDNIKDSTTYHTTTISANLQSNSVCWVANPSSSGNTPSATFTSLSSPKVNGTISLKTKLSNDGSSYSESTSVGATVSMTSAWVGESWTSVGGTSSVSGTNSTSYDDFFYAANTTFSYSGLDTSKYTFTGWQDSSGNVISTDSTCKVNPTATCTYYACFKKVSSSGGGTSDTNYIYLNDAANWNKCMVYLYGPGEAFGAWTGREFTTKDSNGFYKIDISSLTNPENYNVIFHNNSGSQTSDNNKIQPGRVYNNSTKQWTDYESSGGDDDSKTWYLSGNLTKDGTNYPGVGYADDKFKMTQSSTDPNKYTLTYSATGIQYATVNDGTTPYHPANNGASSGTVYDPSQSSVSPASAPSWHTTTLATGTQITFTWDTSNNSLSWTTSSSGGDEVGEPSGWYLHGNPAGGWGTGQKSKQLYKISSGLCYIDVNFTGSNNYFRFHDGSKDYGALNNQNNVKVYNNSTEVGFTSTYTGAFQYSSEPGNVRIWLNPTTSKFWIEPGEVIKPLADDVTVSAKFDNNGTTSGMTGETVTVTASLVKPADGVIYDSSNANCNVTYTLYKNGTSTGKTNNTGIFTGLTSSSSGQVSYTVKVTTTATYTNSSNNQQTYADVTSSTPAIVTYNALGLYYADITNGTSDVSWTQISDSDTTYTIEATVSSGDSYTFVLSDNGAFNPDYSVSYSIDSSKCSYCTVTKGNIMEGVTTYTVKCNAGCKNPKIVIDKENRTIYAVADFTPTTTKTEDSKETVTYYFAEMTNDVNWVYNGAGVKIRYWNNSTGKNETKTITTPAKVNGSNQIRVNTGELFNGPNAGYQTFNVYKTELPIWATSFVFIDSDGNDIYATSNSYNYYTYSSIALNPNRIYLFYATANGNDVRRYTKGVILDEQLWNSNNTTNYVKTKTFKANLVNYNDSLGTLNSALSTAYKNSSIKNPLYFGYFENSSSGSSYYSFDLANNLAQRASDNAYYASVWGLTGSKLYYPARSIATYGTLTDANNKVHPLFDYDSLASNSSIASLVETGLNFPFCEATYNGITTYSYDSTTDYNRKYSTTDKDFYVTEDYELGMDAGGAKYTGYFPFGGNNDTKANTGFGTEFDIDFYMTDSGKLIGSDNSEQDICFNFSGDDDVWVYIDGVLALDLGGDHKVSAGSINFTDMKVYYKSTAKDTDEISSHNVTDSYATSSSYIKVVDLAELFAANGVTFDNTDPSTMHTLQMFYMERGTFQSNCAISFNLPQNSGLRINSDVDTSKVNPAFVNDTLMSANQDFFSYTLTNKAASETEYNKVKTAYPTAAGRATALSTSGLSLDAPQFPILSNVNRDFNGIIYRLSLSTNTESPTGSENYISNASSTSFIPVKGVNYKLNDAYAKSATDDDALMGVSGRTDSTGSFKLLFDQSAQFDTKITPNSLVSVVQNNSLYDVVSQTGSIVTNSDTATRNVSDYYSSKYTITDDRSGKVIYSNDSLTKNRNGGISADDNADNDPSFYFSNYTGDATDSSYAMTVTFINSVDVGTIKIEKSLSAGLTANADKFFFDVEFSDVFDGASAKKKYTDLTYTVYTKDNIKVSENTYGSTGIILQAGQYALIEGVPVGTQYTVTERTRVGYAIESVTAKAESTLGAVINSNTVTVNNNVVTGNIPFVTDYDPAEYVSSSISTSSFVNIRQAITITFKYYDREVVSGTVSHINEQATVYNHTFAELPPAYCTLNSDGEVVNIQLSGLITHAAVEFSTQTNVTNVIDEYKMWTSQANAEKDMASITYLKENRLYNSSEIAYHTNAYGVPQIDGEKWVNYYDAAGNSLDAESFTSGDAASYSQIKSITVWLFNQPRQYTLTMNYAENSSHLGSANADGNFVASGNKSTSFSGYYNQRLGGKQSVSSQDSAGEYLNKYGITDGFVGSSVTTNPVITKGDQDLKFLYWSDKADGSTIVSTDIAYLFRITGNRTLYAVYGKTMTDKPGLTVSENQKDIFFDTNGVSKTRLNTQMNTYNCPDYDKNISQTAIVYLMIHDDIVIDNVTKDANDKTQLDRVRDQIAEILKNTTSTSVSGKIIEISKNANGFIYNVKDSAADVTTSSDVTLTNKNRMQFSITFPTNTLNSGKVRMCAFAAMNYSGEWIVSDNYVDYDFLTKSTS